MSVIIPGKLYLGGALDSAYNDDFMTNNKITHVINCTKELHMRYPRNTIAYRIALEDDNSDGSHELIQKGAILLKSWIDDPNAIILIHCVAGMSRSVSIVVAYLVINKNYTVKDAVNFLTTCRSCIRPFKGFLEQIQKHETYSAKVYNCLIPKICN
jgi:protein-tyrosine phosphatase